MKQKGSSDVKGSSMASWSTFIFNSEAWMGSVLNIIIFAYSFGDVSGAEITHFSLKTLRLEIQNTPIKASRANKNKNLKNTAPPCVWTIYKIQHTGTHWQSIRTQRTSWQKTETRTNLKLSHLYQENHKYQHIALQTIHYINGLSLNWHQQSVLNWPVILH